LIPSKKINYSQKKSKNQGNKNGSFLIKGKKVKESSSITIKLVPMKKKSSAYYVRIRPQLNGRNIVHRNGCPFLPDVGDRIYLGEFSTPLMSLMMARLYFPEVSFCMFCIGPSKGVEDWICNNDFNWN
jgi:hypothetical protein